MFEIYIVLINSSAAQDQTIQTDLISEKQVKTMSSATVVALVLLMFVCLKFLLVSVFQCR